MFNVIYSSHHDAYGTLPVGERLTSSADWRIVAVVPSREAAREWVKVEQSALATLKAKTDAAATRFTFLSR